ncbi:MAG: PspA/IM30 family protein [Candidatus Andeanibacterium colombiense]|uniref:PspA/IM30 family protein n=1 Tax=Candidatus Andeanibacterium colombiense TaxID=3121345 RepID=A0AAJ5X4X7_9SPHN|nr:MAG: PspA/IM30 family protein [Sphingomonadaceae bacterium]
MDGTIAGIATRATELVASNLASLIEQATHPEKMLRLLRTEIEESVIALQDTLTKANRRYGRLEGELPRLEAAAKDWTARARLALDKGREDLARGALQAREAAQQEFEEARALLGTLKAEAEAATGAIAALEAKLSEIRRQLAQFAAPARGTGGENGAIARRLDRIDALERRVANGLGNRGPLSEDELVRQLRELEQGERIDAELDRLKAAAGKKKR